MNNERFYLLSSTDEGASLLVKTIIEDYGVKDFLNCIFFDFNQEDQQRFLLTALQKAGAK